MSKVLSDSLHTDEHATIFGQRHGNLVRQPGQLHDQVLQKASEMTDNRPQHGADISNIQKMLSAVSGSLLTSLLVTPLDVVRVRLQSQIQPAKQNSLSTTSPSRFPSFYKISPSIGVTNCCREVFWVNNASNYCIANASETVTYTALNPALSSSSSSVAADCAVDEARQKTFTSTLDGLRKIARNEGFTSLWRGLSPTLVMAVPANVIYFTGYDALRWNLSSPIQNYVHDSYAPLVAGSVARVAAAAAVSPIEMFRTRMQASTSHGVSLFKDTILGMRSLVQTQGVSSLWRGITLTMWRDVPFSGIYWWGYETIRTRLTDWRYERGERLHRDHPDSPTFVDSFVAGAASGAVASILTSPFDVGKTRQQVAEHAVTKNDGQATSRALRPEERSMPRFIQAIWKEEGMAGLFRGWAARTMKVAPACAIMISSYEVGKKMAKSMNEKSQAGSEVG